jgi:predicted RND superfamily exporter protein
LSGCAATGQCYRVLSRSLSLSLSLTRSLHGLSLSDRWELGIVEAISLTILVGLSCDFGLHLAESYAQSPLTDRKARAMDSVQRMGSPICSAALTTVLGVLPMCFSTLQVTLP